MKNLTAGDHFDAGVRLVEALLKDTVRVEGSVETIGFVRKVDLAVTSVDGVRRGRDRLLTTGVDAQ